jgi:hypothetical protein
MSQKSGAGYTTLDGPTRRFCLHDAVTTRTGQFRANLPDHLKPLRHIFQHFRNIFSQMLQLPTTVRARFLLRQILPHFAGQMIW